jgi:hypothetical protein
VYKAQGIAPGTAPPPFLIKPCKGDVPGFASLGLVVSLSHGPGALPAETLILIHKSRRDSPAGGEARDAEHKNQVGGGSRRLLNRRAKPG